MRIVITLLIAFSCYGRGQRNAGGEAAAGIMAWDSRTADTAGLCGPIPACAKGGSNRLYLENAKVVAAARQGHESSTEL